MRVRGVIVTLATTWVACDTSLQLPNEDLGEASHGSGEQIQRALKASDESLRQLEAFGISLKSHVSADMAPPIGFKFQNPQENTSDLLHLKQWPFDNTLHEVMVVTEDLRTGQVVDGDLALRWRPEGEPLSPEAVSDSVVKEAVVTDKSVLGTGRVIQATVTSKAEERLLHSKLVIQTEHCLQGACPQRFGLAVWGGVQGHFRQSIAGKTWPWLDEPVAFLFPEIHSEGAGPVPYIYRLQDMSEQGAWREATQSLKSRGALPKKRSTTRSQH